MDNCALNIFIILLCNYIPCVLSELMLNCCVFLLSWNKIKVFHCAEWCVDVFADDTLNPPIGHALIISWGGWDVDISRQCGLDHVRAVNDLKT